jgi:O-antigen ligase
VINLHNFNNRVGHTLLFLFPVFAVSLRHWVSVIFWLLVIMGIFSLRNNLQRITLGRPEKWLLWLMALFFIAFIVSSSVSGWNEGSVRLIERELRFLLFVPLFLFLRYLSRPLELFGLGSLVAIALNFLIVLFQVFELDVGRDVGVYGPLFTGPVSILFLVAALFYIRTEFHGRLQILLVLSSFGLVLIIAVLTSRSALLGLITVAITLSIAYWKTNKAYAAFFFLGFILVGFAEIFQLSSAVSFQTAFGELSQYIRYQVSQPGTLNPYADTSVGVRLEMLRSIGFLLLEYPVFGAGGYEFNAVMSKYVAQGLVSKSVLLHAHPHNVFAQVIASKGLVGLFVFIGILVSASSTFSSRNAAGEQWKADWYGIAFLTCLLAMMQTESAMVLKGNFIAVFLLMLGIFMANRSRSINVR